MSVAARYAVGVTGVALSALAVGAALGPPLRTAAWVAVGLALPIQVPLGWWLVRTVGTDRLLPVWGIGMMGRLSLLAVGAWVIGPLAGVPRGPFLAILAVVLVALLGVELVTLTSQVRHGGVR